MPESASPENNGEPRRRRFFLAACLGAFLACLVLLPLGAWAYKYGVSKGYKLGEEHERSLFREAPQPPQPVEILAKAVAKSNEAASGRPKPALAPQAEELERKSPSHADPKQAPVEFESREAWCFGTAECARLVWPMEIVEQSDAWPHPHFRIRQGANRLAMPGMGLCEFAFASTKQSQVLVYTHCRYTDECGNSLYCQVDGGRNMPLGKLNVFDQWLWDSAHGQFSVGPGLHRLTITTRCDGLEFDRVVASTRPLTPKELDGLEFTPPPAFESLPIAAPTLPAINGVTAAAMADHSCVIGAGHRNTLTVFVRLNNQERVQGEIHLKHLNWGIPAPFEKRGFELSPDHRTELIKWDLKMIGGQPFLQPVVVDVFAQGRCVHSQQLNFIRPLSWAFLGPFPDPEQRGLYLSLEPDKRIAELPQRPEFAGAKWKIVEDGSCYDEFGVVDLNKVYGRPNERWSRNLTPAPAVVYAVTCANTPSSHHLILAFAGDDCLRGWVNGRPLIQQNSNVPLETTRLIMGVEVGSGKNFFVFKVSQSVLYWQLLFEPDGSLPYSHPYNFAPCPVSEWK